MGTEVNLKQTSTFHTYKGPLCKIVQHAPWKSNKYILSPEVFLYKYLYQANCLSPMTFFHTACKKAKVNIFLRNTLNEGSLDIVTVEAVDYGCNMQIRLFICLSMCEVGRRLAKEKYEL